MIEIFDPAFDALTRTMQIAAKKQEVISHNIANAKTPGYEALTFNEELMRAEKRQDRKQVIIEEEMTGLAKNSGKFSAAVKLLTSKINILKTIASQGRR